jgi:hypothetical protein
MLIPPKNFASKDVAVLMMITSIIEFVPLGISGKISWLLIAFCLMSELRTDWERTRNG